MPQAWELREPAFRAQAFPAAGDDGVDGEGDDTVARRILALSTPTVLFV